MASTYDISAGTSDLLYQNHSPEYQVLSKVVDWSKFSGTGTGATSATADIITIPANFVVEDVLCKVLVAGTASSTCGVGDSADSVYYLANAVACDAAANVIVNTGQTAGASGKFKDATSATTLGQKMVKSYTAASKLVVVLGASTAPATGKMQFYVRGYSLI